MKRYNITIESRFNNQRRIKITSADNGEWVRYEDVAEALEQEKVKYAVLSTRYAHDHQRIEQLKAALRDRGPEQTPESYGGTNG